MRPQTRTALLVLAGVLASAASYFFQVRVLATSSSALFVRFSHWLFLAGVAGLPGVLLQSLSGFWLLGASKRGYLLLFSAAVGAAVAITVMFGGASLSSEMVLLFLHFVAFMPMSVLMGQAQAEGHLGPILWGILTPVMARLALYQLLPATDGSAYRAVVLTTGLSVVGLAALLARAQPSQRATGGSLDLNALQRGSVLALVTTVIPYADFELVRATQSAGAAELFGRVSLLTRMVLLGGGVITQAVLPEQLRHYHHKTVETRWWLRHASLLIFGAAVGASFALYIFVQLVPLPFFSTWNKASLSVLLLACLNCSALVLVLSEVQATCIMGKLSRLMPALSLLVLSWCAIYMAKPETLWSTLLASGASYYACVALLYVRKLVPTSPRRA